MVFLTVFFYEGKCYTWFVMSGKIWQACLLLSMACDMEIARHFNAVFTESIIKHISSFRKVANLFRERKVHVNRVFFA